MRDMVERLVDERIWITLAVCAVVAAGLAVPVGRRLGISAAAAFAGLITTLPVLAITVLSRVDSAASGGAAGGLVHGAQRTIDRWTWFDHGWDGIFHSALNDPGWILNVLLFVPAGAVWAIATGWSFPVWVWLTIASFVVETIQSVSGRGIGQVADLVANSLGAAIGVLLGVVVFRTFDGVVQAGRRHPWWVALIAVTMVVIGYALVLITVDSRNDRLLHEVTTAFDGYTSREILRYLDDDQQYMSRAEFEHKVSTPPASITVDRAAATVVVRYAVTAFGLQRCSIARFDAQGAQFSRASGSDCAKATNALPRWDNEFFSASVISANVRPSPASGMNSGS